MKAHKFHKEWALFPHSRLISRSLCTCSKYFLKGCRLPRPFSVPTATLSRDPVEKRSVSKSQLHAVIIKKKKKNYLTDFNEFIFTETKMFIFPHNRVSNFHIFLYRFVEFSRSIKTFVVSMWSGASRTTVRFSTVSPPEKT